ncbi:MAG: hypothetical protein CM15mP87_01420 [Candidatus Neomarinimicrobiota bacterium]|nr:MAG: hypothetical protein CM15mP87_01420 [Candidatus Neomarinimicrobiota bacterium]
MFFVITVTFFPLGVGPGNRTPPNGAWCFPRGAHSFNHAVARPIVSPTTKTGLLGQMLLSPVPLRPWFCRRWLRIGLNRTPDRGPRPPPYSNIRRAGVGVILILLEHLSRVFFGAVGGAPLGRGAAGVLISLLVLPFYIPFFLVFPLLRGDRRVVGATAPPFWLLCFVLQLCRCRRGPGGRGFEAILRMSFWSQRKTPCP